MTKKHPLQRQIIDLLEDRRRLMLSSIVDEVPAPREEVARELEELAGDDIVEQVADRRATEPIFELTTRPKAAVITDDWWIPKARRQPPQRRPHSACGLEQGRGRDTCTTGTTGTGCWSWMMGWRSSTNARHPRDCAAASSMSTRWWSSSRTLSPGLLRRCPGHGQKMSNRHRLTNDSYTLGAFLCCACRFVLSSNCR